MRLPPVPPIVARLAFAGALVSLCPPAAGAQRGGHAPRIGRGSAAGGGIVGDPSPTLTAAAVARLNPIAMLLDRKGELGLADSQVTRLAGMLRGLERRNTPHLASLDSLLGEIRRHGADTTISDGDRLMQKGADRLAFTAVLGRIRDNDDAAALDAMDLFTGRQLRWAYDVVREQRAIMGSVVRGGSIPAGPADSGRSFPTLDQDPTWTAAPSGMERTTPCDALPCCSRS